MFSSVCLQESQSTLAEFDGGFWCRQCQPVVTDIEKKDISGGGGFPREKMWPFVSAALMLKNADKEKEPQNTIYLK